MNESQIDLSCDPAKLDTEVCTVVGDQAALTENATGSTKKSLQQAFDPSLFISRPHAQQALQR